MVLFVQIIIEIPQLLGAVADVLVVRVLQVLTGAVVEETVELPRLHLLRIRRVGQLMIVMMS